MRALALTDHDAVYGAVAFSEACQLHGVNPIFGCELTLHDESHLTLLVENKTGWTNLCRLITLARHNAPKGAARLPDGVLEAHADGLICLTGCAAGPVAGRLGLGDRDGAREALGWLREIFGRNQLYVELQDHQQPADKGRNRQLYQLAVNSGVPYVATNNVHYATPDGQPLHDLLTCIRHLTPIDQAAHLLRPNGHYYLKGDFEMAQAFGQIPQALTNTVEIANRCTFDLTFGIQALPTFPTPDGQPAIRTLYGLCERAVAERYTPVPSDVYAQLYHELAVIERAQLANYFLIVWDIVRFAREKHIGCQGRGSAANSLVAYLLDISPIDPLAHNLVFERFLSNERQKTPDIDIDFDAARREEVIQYVYTRYGAEHVAMACTFSTFRTRSAVRDVCKVLGLSAEHAAYALDVLHEEETADRNALPVAAAKPAATNGLLIDLVQQLRGVPRHLGLHNGGMVIMGAPLADRLPIEPATMPDRTVVQWDKEGLEDVGLVKIDVLGLRMLSAVNEACALLGKTVRETIPQPFDDPAVYQMIAEADTMGVFQVESRAQAQVLPRLKPTCFNDLVVTISLIRPGPVQGNMVNPYLARRAGTAPVEYLHEKLKPALEETLGVILFQEQVLKVARDLAGFTAGQGEQLRRALGRKNAYAALDALRDQFLRGARLSGVSAEIAEQVFGQLRAFGGYSFAKSHAAAFAVLVYQSAWLRKYQPAAFFTALLNNQPMGFWTPAVLIGDARRHGLDVLPVDVQRSGAVCQLEAGQIRLGFNYVKGLRAEDVNQLLSGRPFADLHDLCRRTELPRRLVENLILAGAFDVWHTSRRLLLWQFGRIRYQAGELPLEFVEEGQPLTPETIAERRTLEIARTGLSTGPHIMAELRSSVPQGVIGTQQLARVAAGQRVTIAGLLVVHQAPYTAKGFRFLTLEDEAGLMNVVIRPKLYAQYRRLLASSRLLQVTGLIERRGGVINVIAERISHVTYQPKSTLQEPLVDNALKL